MRFIVGALVAVVGCASPGTITVSIDIDPTCRSYTYSVIYASSDLSCAECHCGSCFDLCDNATCYLACGNGICDADELDAGLQLDPPPGRHALIIELWDDNDVVAQACQDVTVDADGTSSRTLEAVATTCCGALQ